MKKTLIFTLLAGVTFAACNSGSKNSGPVVLQNETDSVSYFIGLTYGTNLTSSGVDNFNFDAMSYGMEQGFNGDSAVSPEVVKAYLMSYFDKLDRKEAQSNEGENLAWLEQNKSNEGVQVSPEGYQYKILKEGTGEKPNAEDTVTVHYTGKLIDGTIFDSSVERGYPAEFPVNKVIKGWTMALQNMPIGSKWELYIPPSLAYGPTRGPGGDLPPNSTLIFEVELIDISRAQ
ncbi:FKBP-type peptidyl-prolyl cis-trans isomerase [bacterium]|nr:FKBP-type peptidyl-prolyl cis-trans isomerase [bacterium]